MAQVPRKQARIIWVNKSNESTKNYGIANTKRSLIQSCAYFMWDAAHALTETIWVFQRYEICWHDTHHIYCPVQAKRNTPWNRQMICIFAQSHVMRVGENVLYWNKPWLPFIDFVSSQIVHFDQVSTFAFMSYFALASQVCQMKTTRSYWKPCHCNHKRTNRRVKLNSIIFICGGIYSYSNTSHICLLTYYALWLFQLQGSVGHRWTLPFRHILPGVCIRCIRSSALSFWNMCCVCGQAIPPLMAGGIYALHLIIVIQSELWSLVQCLSLG